MSHLANINQIRAAYADVGESHMCQYVQVLSTHSRHVTSGISCWWLQLHSQVRLGHLSLLFVITQIRVGPCVQ